jgi:hypothetical protein
VAAIVGQTSAILDKCIWRAPITAIAKLGKGQGMKIVAINNSSTVRNEDGTIRGDMTDLNKILDSIDEAEGRNDAPRAYIYALRDLQRAHDQHTIFRERCRD